MNELIYKYLDRHVTISEFNSMCDRPIFVVILSKELVKIFGGSSYMIFNICYEWLEERKLTQKYLEIT